MKRLSLFLAFLLILPLSAQADPFGFLGGSKKAEDISVSADLANSDSTDVENSDGFFQAVSPAGYTLTRYGDRAWMDADFDPMGYHTITYGTTIYGGGWPDDNYVYDDIYVATGTNANARVEIGNAATYTNCTKLAICTPDTWSDTEVKATVRAG